MKYNFSVSGNALVVSNSDELGRFPIETNSYTNCSAILANNKIYLRENGIDKQNFSFHEIFTVDGNDPIYIEDAFYSILTLISTASFNGSGGGGGGIATQYNSVAFYDTVLDLPITFPTVSIHSISILCKTGTLTMTVGAEEIVLEEGQSTSISATETILQEIIIESCTGTFIASTNF